MRHPGEAERETVRFDRHLYLETVRFDRHLYLAGAKLWPKFMKPAVLSMKSTTAEAGCKLLERITAYPWRRNYKGDLCGAEGQPILFQGVDAVIVQYAPLMLKALLSIHTATVPTSEQENALSRIRLLTVNILAEMEQADADANWCRGSIG
jgi:hypothetical protein